MAITREQRIQQIEQSLAIRRQKLLRGAPLIAATIYTADVAFLLEEVKRLEAEVEQWQQEAAGEDI